MAKVVYDPTKVDINIGGVTITGWADGDICTFEYETDHVSKHIGTGGEGQFIKIPDRSGTFTARVAAYSLANGAMTLIRDAGVPVPITVTDKTSLADTFFTAAAMVQKTPNFGKGAEVTINEWPFIVVSATVVLSGTLEA
jgi:hypothetical protein